MDIKKTIKKIMVHLDEEQSLLTNMNTADYFFKIFPLIDTLQTEIATQVKPIEKYLTVESINKRIDIPSDCYELLKVYDEDLSPINFFKYDGKIFLVESIEDMTCTLYYNKYPDFIDSNTPENKEIEIDKECQEALAYGVCAGLTINDEPELYDTYLDKYNVMIANIVARRQNNCTARIVGGRKI